LTPILWVIALVHQEIETVDNTQERKTVEAKIAKVVTDAYEVNGHTTVDTTITLETGDKFSTSGGTHHRTFSVGDFLKVSFGGNQRIHFHKHDKINVEKKEKTPAETWREVMDRTKKDYAATTFSAKLDTEHFNNYRAYQEADVIEFAERQVLNTLEYHDYVKTEGLSLESISDLLVPSIWFFGVVRFGAAFKIGSSDQFKVRANYCVVTAIRNLKDAGTIAEYQGRYFDNRE
jgi:hypothetical protein